MRVFLACALLLAACASSPAARPEPRPPSRRSAVAPAPLGISDESYLATYLTSEDLPSMRSTQDSRVGLPFEESPEGPLFLEHGGLHAGLHVWMAQGVDAIWRLVDIRYVFPSDEAASRFLRANRDRMSEGADPVRDAPSVGEECSVFGGTTTNPILGVTLTHYYYVLRHRNVVVKIYAAQGAHAPDGSLTSAMLAPIAQRAIARIDSAR